MEQVDHEERMAVETQPLYGSIATAKRLGISLRQLYYWVAVMRVVRPTRRQRGTRRFQYFTAADLKTLAAVKRRLRLGYTLKAAVRAATRRAA